ncbi:TauD/TfdA family dioxygenase [Pelagibius sp. Alg239-R121]|uniref:TauD/TfdA dioxygenase family protein n=1 Tax=Pelagibius sp. Alg239-R121 TaxID=2993448 RepID=UPI0024A6FCC6|nr:TauD/TfdA family dioxygenase [Pelagibius sp. Alg239-R121]
MTSLKVTPLTDTFGVMVHDLNLSKIAEDKEYPVLRALFEEHSALLFRDQELSAEDHLRLARMFGPIEDRMADSRKPGEELGVSPVSNQIADGRVTGEMDMHTLHLKANQLWHIDSTFMPTPSLCNILAAKVVTETGGETELASSRAAWAGMPEALRECIRGKILGHNYRRSRELISPKLAQQSMFNKWPPQRWPAVWANPVNGKEALYIASHVYQVEGMVQSEGKSLIEELMAFCTQPQFTYSHKWKVGDVLLWDQRATLHRGTPWPYDQPRTLASVCCSLQGTDGLDAARTALVNLQV